MNHSKRTGWLIGAVLTALLIVADVFAVRLLECPREPQDAVSVTSEVVSQEKTSPEESASAEEAPVSSQEIPREPLSEQELNKIHQLAEQIILYYGCYGSEADEKIQSLLDSISEIDGGEGVLWKKIMDDWKELNSSFRINTDVPEGLPEGDNLCIVVLGYSLKPDGSMKKELIGRLETALACARRYPDSYVLCTGGGTAGGTAEATAMKKWLLSKGVAPERILAETASMTTTQNAVYSHNKILKKCPQVDSVLIVSSSYHLPWSALVFEAAFLKSAEEKDTPEIHVISNCAYAVTSNYYREKERLRWQTAAMLELVGDRKLSDVFYGSGYSNYLKNKKPKL